MKKIVVASIILMALIGIGIILITNDSNKPHSSPILRPKSHKKQNPPLISTVPEYKDCYPKDSSYKNKQGQREIINTAKAMEQEEKISHGQITPGLQALNDKYYDLIEKYDDCTIVVN